MVNCDPFAFVQVPILLSAKLEKLNSEYRQYANKKRRKKNQQARDQTTKRHRIPFTAAHTAHYIPVRSALQQLSPTHKAVSVART